MIGADFDKKVTKRMAECAEAAVEELAARGEFVGCDSLCDAEAVAVRCAKLALALYEDGCDLVMRRAWLERKRVRAARADGADGGRTE